VEGDVNMSEEIRRQAPYYDDFDPSTQYSHILAVPGRVEQAREFTQIQSLLFSYLKKLSDTIIKDGNVVSGMGFNFSDTHLIVEDGRVYIDGKIHEFKAQDIAVTKQGEEIIGVKLVEEVVTEEQDPTLRDPAQNMANYGQPGAHRIKSAPVLTLNDPEAPTIFEFFDGQLQVDVSKPGLDGILDILAKRTHDESGNYRVRGLTLFSEPYDANNVHLVIEAGTAYILGYDVTKPTPVKRIIPMSKDTRETLNEPKMYVSGTSNYALNNFPVQQINSVVAMVETTGTVTRGAAGGGIDYLPKNPVVSIQSVTAGATTYIQGTDYQLTSDGVDWSLGGAEPSPGSSYTVTYRYNKEMIKGTDFDLYQEEDAWGATKDYVRFLSGNRPVNNSQFTVDYDFYLSRIDVVSMNKKGEIIVTTGQSDIDRHVKPPTIIDPEVLQLGYIYLPANSGNAKATSKSVTRLEMSTLERMLKRLEDVEYNQAITQLDQEAMQGEAPTDMRGVFSDSFRTSSKGDLTHPDFSVMYSLEDGMIMLPPLDITDQNPVVNEGESNAKIWGRLITAPLTEKVAIDQFYATTTMKINPYLAFNSMGKLDLNPSVDNWIDNDYIKIENTEFESRNFYRWWSGNHIKDEWRYDVNADIMDLELDGIPGSVEDWRPAWERGGFPQATALKTEKSKTILEEAITFMRQRTVTIKATNLSPASDNLEAYFDGVRVSLTPKSGYLAGSTSGTVRSNSSGVVEATFVVPPNIRTGTREVVLKNNENTASAAYTSIGTKKTVVDKIINTRITLTAIDPLAQTFQFDGETILTSVGAYFAAKDNVHNVSVQVRDVVNGYPGNKIFAEKILNPSQINVSEDATLETKVTFDDPVLCQSQQQYCVVYLTDSDVHSMYVSDLGKNDVTTGATVARQPYLAGLLFSSSNGLAWTAHQSMNMKFKVYKAEFEPTGTVEFDPIFGMSADKVLLLSDFLTPNNTGCIWEMSLDDRPYQPVTSYEDVDLSAVVDKIKLRATFKSDKNMSPLMAKDSFTLVGFLHDTSGSYVSRNTEMLEPYETVKQVYEAHIPPGCTITPQFSHDDGQTWITAAQVDSSQVTSNWTRLTHEHTLPAGTNAMNFRARVNITATSSVVRPKVRKFMNIMK
jgi:hypothetical protein